APAPRLARAYAPQASARARTRTPRASFPMPLEIFASGRDDPCWSPQAEGSADRQSIACRADRCVRPFTPPPQREWISPNRTLWNASLGLLRLDPGELHDLAPLFRFIRDHFSEVSRRHRCRHAAKLAETRFHLGI